MEKQVGVVLAGIGGYGANYVRELLSPKDPAIVFAGVVDPFAERSLKLRNNVFWKFH